MKRTMRQRICHLLAVVLLTSMAGLYGADEGGAIHAVNLRSEYMTNPSGIDVVRPLLSWVPESRDPSARSLQQTAYQVLVSPRWSCWRETRATSGTVER